jgi:hypothetical protein
VVSDYFENYWKTKKRLERLGSEGCVVQALEVITHRRLTQEQKLIRAIQLETPETDDTDDIETLINIIRGQPDTFAGEALADMEIERRQMTAQEIRDRAKKGTRLMVTDFESPIGLPHAAMLTPRADGGFDHNYDKVWITLDESKAYPVFTFDMKV